MCATDNKTIINPRNIIHFGLLCSDEEEPIHKYNFITLNKENIHKWTYKKDFIREAHSFIDLRKWESDSDTNKIAALLKQIEDTR